MTIPRIRIRRQAAGHHTPMKYRCFKLKKIRNVPNTHVEDHRLKGQKVNDK
jgi:hypothetical protein